MHRDITFLDTDIPCGLVGGEHIARVRDNTALDNNWIALTKLDNRQGIAMVSTYRQYCSPKHTRPLQENMT